MQECSGGSAGPLVEIRAAFVTSSSALISPKRNNCDRAEFERGVRSWSTLGRSGEMGFSVSFVSRNYPGGWMRRILIRHSVNPLTS
jgi:hypothetical protein